jgi:hypothetical protein
LEGYGEFYLELIIQREVHWARCGTLKKNVWRGEEVEESYIR